MKTTTWRLSARNALRRPMRTALTTGMVVMGVALLMLGLTWINGVMGQALATATAAGGHVRVVKPAFVEREELNPLEENLQDVAALEQAVRRVPGVVAVEPRIMTGVTVTVGEELGDTFAQAVGARESYFKGQLHADQKVVRGTWFTGAKDELVLGARVAEQAGAKVGDELLLLGMTQDGSLSPVKGKLVGIVREGGALDRQVLLPLEKVQWMTDVGEGATELLVFGGRYQDAPQLAAAVRAAPELKDVAVQAWGDREPWKSLGQTVKSMQAVIVLVIVFLAALGIWNTMMMSVLERTHEVGVLRAMGLSRLRAVMLFVGEAVAIGVIGGLVGVALAIGPALALSKYGIHIGAQTAANMDGMIAETVYGDVSAQVVVLSFVLGLVMAVVGSLLPALRAASIQPVSAMRSGR